MRNCQVHCTLTPLSRTYNMGQPIPSTKTRTISVVHHLYTANQRSCPLEQVSWMAQTPPLQMRHAWMSRWLALTRMHNSQKFILPSKILIGDPPQEEKFLSYQAEKWNLFTFYLFFTLFLSFSFLNTSDNYMENGVLSSYFYKILWLMSFFLPSCQLFKLQ